MKKKAVGIITFHASVNCGSFMQNWALQRTIEKLGYYPETINFSNYAQQYMHSTLSLRARRREITLKGKFRRIVGTMLTLPVAKKFRKYNADYREFSKKHLNLSKSYSELLELDEDELGYDYYITGSDQVWTVSAIDTDDAYFLPFVKRHRKIAYAPSLGGVKLFDDSLSDTQLDYVKDFDYLSSRESAGCKWLEIKTGVKVEEVLDPTLLLDMLDFKTIEYKSGIKGKYIFFYSIGYEQIVAKKLACKIQKKMNLPVIVWNPQEYLMDKILISNCKQPKTQNPGVWLDLIKNAELVLTTSFHGLALAVTYRKNVYVLKCPDERQKTILQLGLPPHRFITNISEFKNDDVDYSDMEKNLIVARKRSIKYLKDALNRGE